MTISQLEERIREFINSGRKQSALLVDSSKWNKLCSSLDLIGDTELAILSYPSLCSTQDNGASYLIIYGILQTLLLQQDATKNISDSLEIKVKLPKPLEDIRIIRNSAAGHPGQQRENGLSKSCFITRMSISPTSFELMIVYSGDKDYEMIHVDVPQLIKIQKQYLGEVLNKVITELEKQEMEHRSKHRDTKLADLFPTTLNYHFSKVFEATYRSERFTLGNLHLKLIKECIEKFKLELVKRGEWDISQSINYHYEKVIYSMTELEKYFERTENSRLNDEDAYIFTSFLREQVRCLENISAEIDEEYESTP